MKSDSVKKGISTAPNRSLFKALGLTDEEMEQIAKLDKNERYYHRTDEQLVQFANWKPEFENNMEKIV